MGCVKSKSLIPTAHSTVLPNTARKHGPIDVQITQNVRLVWLDSNIDEKSTGYQKTVTHFRHAINNIDTFTDGEECLQFLENVTDEKACLVISGVFAQQIMARVHNLTQVDSIFIFCRKEKYYKEWCKEWSKVQDVFTDIQPLCEALKEAAQQCEQNAISISIINVSDIVAEKSGNRLDPSFMYTQIMKEIFLTIKFESQHFDAFIEHCRQTLADNQKQLGFVDRLVKEYDQHPAIWWYTCDCFLYAMLNRALRTMNADLMIKLGFFIADLHRHIEQLHREQFQDADPNRHFTLYRGQGMEKEGFHKLVVNQGGLVSFNSFLSTSKNSTTSLQFARRALKNPEMVGVFFVMTIDPAESNTPFAFVHDVGYFGAGEEEILFSMNTVFRIGEITAMDGDTRLFQIHLHLVSDKNNDLHELNNYIRQETSPDMEGWYRLGSVLWRMGEAANAQKVYEIFLEQTTQESDKAQTYYQLGVTKSEQGDYPRALLSYGEAVAIWQQSLPPNHPNFASSYNNIGNVYKNMGDYPEALSSYEKALVIQQQSLPLTHPDLAKSYNNIGTVYFSMHDYPKALSSYEKALAIQQQSLSPTHPDLAMSYNNIGTVYSSMGDYPKALSFYEKALAIEQQSLPPTHPDLATAYNNIGNAYSSMGDYPKALSLYEKALAIQQQSLSPTHPDLAIPYYNIGSVYSSMHDYPKALLHHETALAIQQQSLPSTHPDLAKSYNNIGLVYDSMGDYSEALLHHEKALAIREQSLPPTHPDLAWSYNNIGWVYSSMGDYPKALSHHEKALVIQQQSLSPTHPDLASSYDKIGVVYVRMGDYLKALSSHEKALVVRQHSLPPTHPDLASSYNIIGLVYGCTGDYSKVFSSYEKALAIEQRSLPSTHLALADRYSKMGLLHENMGNYFKAHSYLERAVDIAQHSLPENHPVLVNLKVYLALIKNKF